MPVTHEPWLVALSLVVATCLPSGATATAAVDSSRPGKNCVRRPVSASRRTAYAGVRLPTRRLFPSGMNASEATEVPTYRSRFSPAARGLIAAAGVFSTAFR